MSKKVLSSFKITVIFSILLLSCAVFVVRPAAAGVIVVGKCADDGTLMILWYKDSTTGAVVINDYDKIGVDSITLSIYAPNQLGKSINITIITYIEALNKTGNTTIIEKKNYREDTITVSIPNFYAIIHQPIELQSTNITETVEIHYRNVQFIFYHKTKLQIMPYQLTLGQYYANIMMFSAITAITAVFSMRTSKEILKRVKYFPKIDTWKIALLLLIIGGIVVGIYLVAFEVIYFTGLIWLYAILYFLMTLFALQIYTPLPKVWLLDWLPKEQDPSVKALQKGYAQIFTDKIEENGRSVWIRIRPNSFKDFIFRLFGKYTKIRIIGPVLPIIDVYESFDRVLFLKQEPIVINPEINMAALKRLIILAAVIIMAIGGLFVFKPIIAAAIIAATIILFIVIFFVKREVITSAAAKLADKLITEGEIQLISAFEGRIDIEKWIWQLLETSDIVNLKDEYKQKYLKLKSRFEVETDKKAEEYFATYKKIHDERYKVKTLPREPRIPPKKPKEAIVEEEIEETGEQESETGD